MKDHWSKLVRVCTVFRSALSGFVTNGCRRIAPLGVMKGSSLAGRFGAAKKVIFLDVDGVLHSVYVQVLKDVRRCFNPQCLKILRDVVDTTGAVVVLSSNWRLDKDGENKFA